MILKNDKWLWIYDNAVSRNRFWSSLVVVVGIATSACELALRWAGFLDTHHFPFGVAIAIVGASGLLLAFMAWIMLCIDAFLDDNGFG